jgi:hypothetical protein
MDLKLGTNEYSRVGSCDNSLNLVMGYRIELIEKYLEADHEDDTLEKLGLSVRRKYKVRRVNVHFDDIERIIEIPGNDDECKVRLYSGEELLIREGYDDMSIFITSLENLKDDDDDDELGEE